MKIALALIACLASCPTLAAESKYLECEIPGTGAEPLSATSTGPTVKLTITVSEDTGKVSQVFQAGDDTYSFTTDAQFTPTQILYQWTRKRGFVRVDHYSIDRSNLAVELLVEYSGKGKLTPRQGTCNLVTRPATQI